MIHAPRTLALLLAMLASACATNETRTERLERIHWQTLHSEIEEHEEQADRYRTEMQYHLALHTPTQPRGEKAREAGRWAIYHLEYATDATEIWCRKYQPARCNKKLRELRTNLNTLRTTYNNLP